MARTSALLILILLTTACRERPEKAAPLPEAAVDNPVEIDYAKGFAAHTDASGVTYLTVSDPWPEASREYKYALVPRGKLAAITLPADTFDAIIPVPVERPAEPTGARRGPQRSWCAGGRAHRFNAP